MGKECQLSCHTCGTTHTGTAEPQAAAEAAAEVAAATAAAAAAAAAAVTAAAPHVRAGAGAESAPTEPLSSPPPPVADRPALRPSRLSDAATRPSRSAAERLYAAQPSEMQLSLEVTGVLLCGLALLGCFHLARRCGRRRPKSKLGSIQIGA